MFVGKQTHNYPKEATPVSKFFSQILSIFSKGDFARAVIDRKAERNSKGFGSWDQFVAMLFCQLAGAKSLREIYGGLASAFGKLKHLGISKAPGVSTLSYANAHRPWKLYRDVFLQILERCHSIAPGKKFRFKNKLFSLDATVIKLSLSLFPWAEFRQTKGAVKVHLLLDHDGYLPVFANVTTGKENELDVAWRLKFPYGSIVVVDRGFIDYELFAKWTEEGVYFVTRMKRNAAYRVIEENPLPENRNVVKDQIVEFTGHASSSRCPYPMRIVEIVDKETGEIVTFLTNHMKFGPTTIAAVYKDRWQIEIFFKTLKQNLRIKTFVGTTENALLTQIWTALIAILVLKYLQFKSRFNWSMSNLVAMLRFNLFVHRDLYNWLDDPYTLPPKPDEAEQMTLGYV